MIRIFFLGQCSTSAIFTAKLKKIIKKMFFFLSLYAFY